MALRAANGLLDGVTALLVLLAVVWSGYALWDNSRVYAAADNVQAGLLAFKPQPQEDNSLSFGQLRDINPDVCGWLTLDGTAIDSCIYLGVWAQGKSILTVEGLQDADGGLSPSSGPCGGGRRPVRLLHPRHHHVRRGDRGLRQAVHLPLRSRGVQPPQQRLRS